MVSAGSVETSYALCLMACLAIGCGGKTPVPDAGPVDLDGGPNDDGGPVAAQMNDVSILFPVATDGGAASGDLLAASSSGERGVLLPPALYAAIGPTIGSTFLGPPNPGGFGSLQYSDLHAVAMRIDPCFAATAPDPHDLGCLNQLRLIFQEVKISDGEASVGDSALHVFYALSRAELEGLVRSVIALRVASGNTAHLGPLQPHPIMMAEGMSGPFATGLRALILKHAGAQNLTRITRLNANDEVFNWTFDGVDVSNAESAVFTQMVVPTIPDSEIAQSFTGGADPAHTNGQLVPETNSSTDYEQLVEGAADLDAGTVQTQFDGLIQVENPTLFTANTIDCGSCHLATPTELNIVVPIYGLGEQGNPHAFAPDARFVFSGEMAPTLGATADFNLHAFSYNSASSVGINQRTVNETAAIVTYLNTLQ
jgi:hypothetical protein